jgi:hypothetical protein
MMSYGFELAKVDTLAGNLSGLNKSAAFIADLKAQMQRLMPENDPIKAMLSGKMNAGAFAAAGLDPSKLNALTLLSGAQQSWQTERMTAEMRRNLLTFGGAEGRLAISRMDQGQMTIGPELLARTKSAMDAAYQTAIRDAMTYVGTQQEDVGRRIQNTQAAIAAEFSKVGKAISKSVDDATESLIRVINGLNMTLNERLKSEKLPNIEEQIMGIAQGSVLDNLFKRKRTELSSDDEAKFQKFYSDWAQKAGLNPNPDDPHHRYDYRGAWKDQYVPEMNASDNRFHWPSEYKDWDHPNRYVEGMDTINQRMLSMADVYVQGAAVISDSISAAKDSLIEEIRKAVMILNSGFLNKNQSSETSSIQINGNIYGFADFVEQVRIAGLDLRRRNDPQWG